MLLRNYLVFFTFLFIHSPFIISQQEFSSKTIDVGVVVKDLNESLKFYKEVIGMVQVDRTFIDINEDFGKRSGLSNGIPFHVEVLKLGKGEDATEFKLMSFGERPENQQNNFIYDHTGMQYITIFVNDLEPIIKRIKEHEIPFLGDTPTPLSENKYFVLIKSPDDTFIELIGPYNK